MPIIRKEKLHRSVRILVLLIGISSPFSALWADACTAVQPQGEGSEASPYQLSTPAELIWFKTNGSSSHFALTNHIDMSGCPWGGGRSAVFSGTFDGQGHVIDGLSMDASTQKVGFFQEIGNSGAVKNLGLTNVDLVSRFNPLTPDQDGYIGGLAAYSGGSIESSFVTGRVEAIYSGASNGDAMYVGGLVGWGIFTSTTTDAWFSGAAVGGSYVGGLFGRLDNLLEQSFAVGTVEGTYAGGLVGRTTSAGSQEQIINSYSNVAVDGSYAGGLVGRMELTAILRSQAYGPVVGYWYAGGLVAGFWHDGKVYDSMSFGDVVVESTTSCYAGGIAGFRNGTRNPQLFRTIATGSVSHSAAGNCNDATRLGPIVSNTFTATQIPETAFYVNSVPNGNTQGTQATVSELQNIDTYLNATWADTRFDEVIQAVADCNTPSSANLTLCPDHLPFPSVIGLLGVTSAPTGLSATSSFTGIELSWAAPSDLGNSEIIGYRIETSTNGTDWATAVTNTQTPFTERALDGLSLGTSYYVRLSALNGMGASTPVTTPVSVTAGTVPGPPTNLAVNAVRTTEVDLTWSAPSVSGASPIVDYDIEVSDDGGNSWVSFSDGVSTESEATVTGLTEGNGYQFRVLARNTQGASAPSSATSDIVVGDVPDPPTNLRRDVWAADEVGLTWTASVSGTGPIMGYTVQYSGDNGASWIEFSTTTQTQLTVTGLTEGDEYQFRVIASNAVGESSPSEVLTEVAGLLPSLPQDISATVEFDAGQIWLQWSEPASSGSTAVETYTVEQNINDTGWQTRATIDANQSPILLIMSGWSAGDVVSFRVFATNSVGNGPALQYSSVAFVGAPSQPINVYVPTCPQSSLFVYWNAPVSLNGSTIAEYKVDVSTDGGGSWSAASSGTGSTARIFEDTSVTPDQSYVYRVAAVTTTGLVSEWSSPSSGASPSPYAGGCGTAVQPYQIETWTQLNEVRNNLDAHFVLNTDLDPSTVGYSTHVKDGDALANTGQGWAPIGTASTPFIGSFDGGNRRIVGLEIQRAETGIGLFGMIGSGASLRNLNLLDVSIEGNEYTAGLVGQALAGSGPLSSVHVTGEVLSDSDHVGCVAGQSHALVSKAHVDCMVTGANQVGGLIGESTSSISQSSSAGSVTGATDVGGLVGQTSALVQTSFSRSNVIGNQNVGGLIGLHTDTAVQNTYAIGTVTGAVSSSTAGLVGTMAATSACAGVSNSYVAGEVNGGNSGDAFANSSTDCTAHSATFFDSEVSGQTSMLASGQSSAQMRQSVTFSGWDFTANTGIWAIEQGDRRSYPYLQAIVYDAPGTTPEIQPIPGLVWQPDAPTSVSAVAGDGQATVAWVAPGSDGGGAITGYQVTASPGGLTCTSAELFCNVTGLANGVAYTFTVSAINVVGLGPASTASTPVTPVGVPGPPTDVAASFGDKQVIVSWAAPANTGGSPITSYEVTSTPGGVTCTTAQLSCAVTGLVNGTSYTFTVVAKNTVGGSAPSLASSAVTPATVPDAPTIGLVVARMGQAEVPFTAPANNGGSEIITYTATSSPGGITADLSQSGSGVIVVKGLDIDTAYTFTVTATNKAGTSAPSAVSNVVTIAQFERHGLVYEAIPGTSHVSLVGRTLDNVDTQIAIPSTIAHGGEVLQVTRIGDRAFEANDVLDSSEISGSLMSEDVVSASSRLTSITIPSGVQSIGAHAFAGNDLTTLTIPESVQTIGEQAFYNNSLTSASFLGPFGEFSLTMFEENDGLSKITYDCQNDSGWPQTFNNGVREIETTSSSCDSSGAIFKDRFQKTN